MSDKYILVDGVPVAEPDVLKWAEWFEKADRKVAHARISNVDISTVFLGMDHAFGGGEPILFEAMIFGGKHDEYQERLSPR